MGKNDLTDEEIKIIATEPLIRMAQLKCLPDKLGLSDIATLLFYHRRKEPPPPHPYFELMAAMNRFICWVNIRIERGHIPSEGRTGKKISLMDFIKYVDSNDSDTRERFDIVPGPQIFEEILSKDTIKTCLDILGLWPLEDGCLLANWWENPVNQPIIKTKKPKKPKGHDLNLRCEFFQKYWEAKTEEDRESLGWPEIEMELKALDNDLWSKGFDEFKKEARNRRLITKRITGPKPRQWRP